MISASISAGDGADDGDEVAAGTPQLGDAVLVELDLPALGDAEARDAEVDDVRAGGRCRRGWEPPPMPPDPSSGAVVSSSVSSSVSAPENDASLALDSVLDSSALSVGSGSGPGGSAGSGASSVEGPAPRSGSRTIPVSSGFIGPSSEPAAATPWPMAPARTMVATTAPTTIAVRELSRGAAPTGVGLSDGLESTRSSLRLRVRVTLLPARVAVPQTTQKFAPSRAASRRRGRTPCRGPRPCAPCRG